MTDITTTIQPGPAQQIAAALPNGFTIRNQSTTTAVWISGNSNVSPGNGMKLSALGSLTWSGGACYAALDTTTGTAALSVSSTTTNVTDPVAVAQAINAQGVPSVLAGNVITGVTVNAPFAVGQYASVSFSIDITAPTGGYVAVTSWADSNASLAIKTEYIEAVYTWHGYTITVPVYGPYMSINAGGCSIAINAVYASNRLVQTVATTSTDFHWDVPASSSYPAGFTYPGGVFATQGGPSTWYLRAASTFKGAFGFQYWDLQGANPPGQMATMQFVSTPQMTTDDGGNLSAVVQQNLPRGILQPFFYNQTAGSYGNMRIIGIVS